MNIDTVQTQSRNTITVGTGATIHGYSDSHACTVTRVSASGRKVTVRQDKATLLNGHGSGAPDELVFSVGGFCAHVSGVQRYAYEADPNGSESTFTLRTLKNGGERWVRVGETTRGGSSLTIGERREHYDYNF